MEPTEIDKFTDDVMSSLPYSSLQHLEENSPKALPIINDYKSKIQQNIGQMQDISNQKYSPSDVIAEQIKMAKDDYSKATKPIEDDSISRAIVSLGPALAGMLTGESGSLAAVPAQKQAQGMYEEQRKIDLENQARAKEAARKRYEDALNLKKQEKEEYDKAQQRKIEGLKSQMAGNEQLAKLGLREDQIKSKFSKEKGGRGLTTSATENLAGSDVALSQLNDTKNLVENNPEMFGKGTSLIGSAAAAFGVGETGTKAASLDADLRSKAQMIGRYLEGGKLAEGDINRYRKMLPERGDKPEIVQNKIATLERMIQQKYNADLSAYGSSGYDVGKFKTKEVSKGLTEGLKNQSSNKKPDWAL